MNVRIYGYGGLSQVQPLMPRHLSKSIVLLPEEGYQWMQLLPVDNITPQQTAVIIPDRANMIRVEVPDGQSIYYEMNMGGPSASNARLAGPLSPSMVGFEAFPWYPGATISVLSVNVPPIPPPPSDITLDFTKPKHIIYIPALIH